MALTIEDARQDVVDAAVWAYRLDRLAFKLDPLERAVEIYLSFTSTGTYMKTHWWDGNDG